MIWLAVVVAVPPGPVAENVQFVVPMYADDATAVDCTLIPIGRLPVPVKAPVQLHVTGYRHALRNALAAACRS